MEARVADYTEPVDHTIRAVHRQLARLVREVELEAQTSDDALKGG